MNANIKCMACTIQSSVALRIQCFLIIIQSIFNDVSRKFKLSRKSLAGSMLLYRVVEMNMD